MTTRALQSKDWMEVKEIVGLENFTSIYQDVVSGKLIQRGNYCKS